MDWGVVGPTAGVAITAIAGIVVERIRARAATKKEIAEAVAAAIDKEVASLDERVAKIEQLEDADKVKLLADVAKAVLDVEKMGRELAVLRADHDRRWAEEDARKSRSAARLEKRDREENVALLDRERRYERLATQVEQILEALRDRRR